MKGQATITSDEWMALAGNWHGVSPWTAVTQEMIDRFAEATLDRQFIHTDPTRARTESPFGQTIAHGFLTLSLLSHFIAGTMPTISGARMGINYGFEKVRFLTPVPSDCHVRGCFQLIEATMRKPTELLSRFAVTVEIENHAKPALAAEWLTLRILGNYEQEENR